MQQEKIMINKNSWRFFQLYEIDNRTELSDIELTSIETIEKKIKEEPDSAGNLIRKRFENILEIS
mgnify:FL=1